MILCCIILSNLQTKEVNLHSLLLIQLFKMHFNRNASFYYKLCKLENSLISCALVNLHFYIWLFTLFSHVLLLCRLINGKCQNTLRIHSCVVYHICNCVKMEVGNMSNMKCDIYENVSENCDLQNVLLFWPILLLAFYTKGWG